VDDGLVGRPRADRHPGHPPSQIAASNAFRAPTNPVIQSIHLGSS
jgi:hypothetical protein